MDIEIIEQSGLPRLIGNQSSRAGAALAGAPSAPAGDPPGGGLRAIVSAPPCEAILDFDGNQIWPNPEMPRLGCGGLSDG